MKLRHLSAILFCATTAMGQTDRRHDTVGSDLRALSRVATLSKNLYDTRQVMTAIVEENIEEFREPRGDGTYRWAQFQREEASRVTEERTVDKIHSEDKLTSIVVSAPRAYRLLVSVPKKRGVFAENNPVFLRNAVVEWTAFNGRRNQQDLPAGAWVKPGDSHGIALPEIGKSAKVTVNLGTENSEKRAVAQAILLQARLLDDPANPNYPVVRRLLGIHALLEREQLKRSDLKTAIDEAILALPGELEKRFTEDESQTAERMALARSGQMRGSVSFGDATPDVVGQLDEINRLLAGTFDEQARAREKLLALIELLRAPAIP